MKKSVLNRCTYHRVTLLAPERVSVCVSIVVVISMAGCSWAAEITDRVVPLLNAHAHNDYWHVRPLLDALDHGFTSVEADVFLRDNQLLVGHEEQELRAGRTLESLYLQPLQQHIRRNGGSVYANSRFLLFVDIKTESRTTREALRELLSAYAEMVGTDRDGSGAPAVTVVISGSAPRLEIVHDKMRYAGADGRLADIDSKLSTPAMPVISDRWHAHFRWDGNGAFPKDERLRLREMAERTHTSGRLLRFWGTPENERLWSELLDAGVDLINTDELERLSRFLHARETAAAIAPE